MGKRARDSGIVTLLFLALVAGFVPVARACDALDLYLILYVQSKASMGQKPELVVLFDEALKGVMDELFSAFRAMHPELRIRAEASSSRTALRKVVDLRKAVDLIVVSDARLVTGYLVPALTGSYVQFAQDAMVLVHQKGKAGTRELADGAWVEKLGREGYRLACVDPEKDACGYRSLLVWKLAQSRWAGRGARGLASRLLDSCPPSRRAADVAGVLAMLERGEADCAFVYRSVARQRKLDWVELAPEVNLGTGDHFRSHPAYGTVSVDVPGPVAGKTDRVVGDRVTYCLAMVKTGPNLEASKNFMRFLVAEDGSKALKRGGVDPIPWKDVFRESIMKFPNRQVKDTERRLSGFRGTGAPGTAGEGLAPARPVGRLNEGPLQRPGSVKLMSPSSLWSVRGEVRPAAMPR